MPFWGRQSPSGQTTCVIQSIFTAPSVAHSFAHTPNRAHVLIFTRKPHVEQVLRGRRPTRHVPTPPAACSLASCPFPARGRTLPPSSHDRQGPGPHFVLKALAQMPTSAL